MDHHPSSVLDGACIRCQYLEHVVEAVPGDKALVEMISQDDSITTSEFIISRVWLNIRRIMLLKWDRLTGFQVGSIRQLYVTS